MSDDDEDKALLDAVSRIPGAWHCIECHHDFRNGPFDPAPYARRTERDRRGDVRIVGDICEGCYRKGAKL
jgi:hypothetical protein